MVKKNKSKAAKAGSIKSSRKNLFLFISILGVVAVSGCIVPGGDVFSGMFGPQRPATTEASADLITTHNLNIIPNPPISAENGFTVSFEVKNNDENEEVKNVAVNYYDTGLCKTGKSSSSSSGGDGSVTESDIVKSLTRVRLISLKADCKGDGTQIETMFLEENEEKSIDVCGTASNFKASISDNTLTFLKDKSPLKTVKNVEKSTNDLVYEKYDTQAGKLWDCLEGKYGENDKYKDNCFLADGNKRYSMISAEYKERAECMGNSQCFVSESACTDACDKRNTDCKGGADNKVGCYAKYGPGGTVNENSDLLTACNNQCDKYRYEVKQSQDAPCNPIIESVLKNRNIVEGSYDGTCCVCDMVSQTIDTSASTTTSSSTTKTGAKTYFPLQTELKEWDFTAPKNSEIGNMPRTCGIKYKITYDFTAKTQTDVSVISAAKMSEMQRAGQEPSANPTQSVGVGPIKVFFDFGVKQPIKSGDVMPVFITVEDRGSGIYSKVLAGKLKIKMPANFEKIVCDKFSGSGGEFKNTADIPMIKKKSPQLRCSFKMPSVTDIKTFYITAELPYEYKLDDEIKVSVNPTLVR